MTISRRRFLQGLGAAGAAAGLSACGKKNQLVEPPVARPASPVLVIVNLDGGNDWLSMLPPDEASGSRAAYLAARPRLAVPTDPAQNKLTTIGPGIGLATDLTGMDYLSNIGRVAWIPGVGMNNPNLSHFVSIDLWGQGSAAPDGTGWLGRFADGAFDPRGDVLRGITVTGDLPVMLRGKQRSFVSIGNSSGYVFPAALRGGRLAARWEPALLEAQWGAAVDPAAVDPGAAAGYAAAAQAGKAFLDAQNGFGTDGALPARTPAVLYPGDANYLNGDALGRGQRVGGGALPGGLASQLKLVAQMIANRIPGEVFFTRLGGWDTHANQAVDHTNLMRTLGGSLSAFYDDLATIDTPEGNARDRTMVLVWSEFGRRVKENDGGTDHGTAGLAFCMGRGVRGGFYGAYPDLNDLDRNGNMKFTVDFRSLYATVLEGWLGRSAAEADQLLGSPGTPYPRLGFV